MHEQAGKLTGLILSAEYTFNGFGFHFFASRQRYRVGKYLADGSRGQVDQPDRGHHPNDKDDGYEVDLPADGPLNLQRDDPGIHADVHGAGNAGQDRAADFHEIPHTRELALDGGGIGRVRVQNLLGDARNEGVGENLAGFVPYVDVVDALYLDELIDQ